MYRDLFEAVEQGGAVLTASKRLARSLTEEFTRYQRNKGRSVWRSPEILPWDGFIERCLVDSELLVLNELQERAIWESVIEESPAGRTLLRIRETASKAMDSWRLAHEYRLPLRDGRFQASTDSEAFLEWSREFESRRDARGWLERARASDRAAQLVREGRIGRPFPLYLAGFDELTPQQQELLDALCGGTRWQAPARGSLIPSLAALPDREAELRAAAWWARERLERSPSARIGVLVPDLERLRNAAERIFTEALPPEAFHISLGRSLRDYPLVMAALRVLELVAGRVPVERVGALIRSPYLQGASKQAGERALIDATLRRKRVGLLGLEDVTEFRLLAKEAARIPLEQYASQWSRSFSRLLSTAGWPGDAVLTSAEYQTLDHWNSALSKLASLDAVRLRMSYSDAFQQLKALLAEMTFEPKDEGAPVQIMGLLESSGLTFDALWAMGLHDEAIPAPARPDPFLPLTLQREYGLPHCSAQRELEFSTRLVERMSRSANEVVFSYPEWEGDQKLAPSPLIASRDPSSGVTGPRTLVSGAVGQSWAEIIHRSVDLETFFDEQGPPVESGTKQSGGARLMQDMAACPFRAFARHRLGVREIEDAPFALDPRQRGNLVHEALGFVWQELRSQDQLLARNADAVDDLIERALEKAFERVNCLGSKLERFRVRQLLNDWLELERKRPPFHVLSAEEKREVVLAGLRMELRIDRLDRVEGERLAILDYKTGEVKSNAWVGDRPDEPQIPLYCATAEHPVASAAFARLKTGSIGLVGISEKADLGQITNMKVAARFDELVDDWRVLLERMARQFRNGHAAVDPKDNSTCNYCEVMALCRVQDVVEDPDAQ